MFEQTFKNIDDILHKDAGCSSELDYVEQTSWILFLKYLDDFEKDKEVIAQLSGKPYTGIIGPEYRWDIWAVPKGKDGKLDHHKAFTGDDLRDFVDGRLFGYLKKFKTSAQSADTIEYKTRNIWFYQLNLDRNLGKTNPLNENDLAEFVTLQKTKADSENSWSVDVADVDKTTFDLSVKNPHRKDETILRKPQEILDEMKRLDEESAEILKGIGGLL